MSNLRFYIPEDLSLGATVKLSDNAAAHATRVLRLNVGDDIHLFNGDGFNYTCELVLIKKSEVLAKVCTRQVCETESPLNITLLQGISSGDRMDFTIQKAVELGVTKIQPLFSERSIVKLTAERAEKRIEHWQNVVNSACEQSGRAFVPKVANPVTLSQWLASTPSPFKGEGWGEGKMPSTRILLNPIGAQRLANMQKPSGNIELLIGAEGGLSQHEIDTAIANGFQSIVLGARILRTETAALTAIAAMQTLWGDF